MLRVPSKQGQAHCITNWAATKAQKTTTRNERTRCSVELFVVLGTNCRSLYFTSSSIHSTQAFHPQRPLEAHPQEASSTPSAILLLYEERTQSREQIPTSCSCQCWATSPEWCCSQRERPRTSASRPTVTTRTFHHPSPHNDIPDLVYSTAFDAWSVRIYQGDRGSRGGEEVKGLGRGGQQLDSRTHTGVL